MDVPVAWRSRASEYGVGKGGLRSITAVSDSLQGLASADHPGWKRLETDSCVRWIRRLVTGRRIKQQDLARPLDLMKNLGLAYHLLAIAPDDPR